MHFTHHALLYAIGFLIVIGGGAYGAYLLGIAPVWIILGSLLVLGIGVATAATSSPSDGHLI